MRRTPTSSSVFKFCYRLSLPVRGRYPPADLVGETVVLFRVRIDEATFTINEAWATKLRNNRNIGDFRNWEDHDPYQKALARLLRDMRIEPA